jgi:hypothetical protein
MEEFRRGGPKPINFKNNSTNILAQSQAKLLNFVKTGLSKINEFKKLPIISKLSQNRHSGSIRKVKTLATTQTTIELLVSTIISVLVIIRTIFAVVLNVVKIILSDGILGILKALFEYFGYSTTSVEQIQDFIEYLTRIIISIWNTVINYLNTYTQLDTYTMNYLIPAVTKTIAASGDYEITLTTSTILHPWNYDSAWTVTLTCYYYSGSGATATKLGACTAIYTFSVDVSGNDTSSASVKNVVTISQPELVDYTDLSREFRTLGTEYLDPLTSLTELGLTFGKVPTSTTGGVYTFTTASGEDFLVSVAEKFTTNSDTVDLVKFTGNIKVVYTQ